MSNWSSSDSEHSQKNKENQRSDQLPAIEANKGVPEMKQSGPPAVLTGEGAEKQIEEKGDKKIVEFVSGDNSNSNGPIGMSEDHPQDVGKKKDEKKEDTTEPDVAEMTQEEPEKREKKRMQKLRTVLRYFMGQGKEDFQRDTEKPASEYEMEPVQGEDSYSQQSEALSSVVPEAEEKREKGIPAGVSDWDSDDEEHQQPKTRWCCWKKQRGASTKGRPYEPTVMSEVTTEKTIEKQPEKEEDEEKSHNSVTGGEHTESAVEQLNEDDNGSGGPAGRTGDHTKDEKDEKKESDKGPGLVELVPETPEEHEKDKKKRWEAYQEEQKRERTEYYAKQNPPKKSKMMSVVDNTKSLIKDQWGKMTGSRQEGDTAGQKDGNEEREEEEETPPEDSEDPEEGEQPSGNNAGGNGDEGEDNGGDGEDKESDGDEDDEDEDDDDEDDEDEDDEDEDDEESDNEDDDDEDENDEDEDADDDKFYAGTPTPPPKPPRQHAQHQESPSAQGDNKIIDMAELAPRGAMKNDDESIGLEELGGTLGELTLMMKEEEKGPATSL